MRHRKHILIMLLDECTSETTALHFCLVWLMYFVLMQINWPFFQFTKRRADSAPVWQLKSGDVWCFENLLLWKYLSSVVSSDAVSTHNETIVSHSKIHNFIKCCTHRFRVIIVRHCQGTGYNYELKSETDLSSLPHHFGHCIQKFVLFATTITDVIQH